MKPGNARRHAIQMHLLDVEKAAREVMSRIIPAPADRGPNR
jgi:hypothetical protein